MNIIGNAVVEKDKSILSILVKDVEYQKIYCLRKMFHMNPLFLKIRHLVFSLRTLFIWLSVAFIIQILYEALVDDFLYDNLIKNHFFGVFNRMLLPAILIIAILAMTFSYLKAKKEIKFYINHNRPLYLLILKLVISYLFHRK